MIRRFIRWLAAEIATEGPMTPEETAALELYAREAKIRDEERFRLSLIDREDEGGQVH